MKMTYEITGKLIPLLLLFGSLLATGCSKDDEDIPDIPGKPNEENVIVLTREVAASIPIFSATSVAPPGEWIFCLEDNDGNEYMIPGSAGEKKDGTYMHLLLPEGTKCITYTVKYVINREETAGYDLGFTITLDEKGIITCQDIWNEDLELFGKGTCEWPYKISSLKDINAISAFCDENGWENTWFQQICDIYCDEGSNKPYNETNGGILPIGTQKPFLGHYNGGGFVINKLKFISSGTTNNIGLFAVAAGNATIDSVHLDVTNILKANKNIGTLVAVLKENAAVTDCSATNGRISGISHVGGLIGCMEGGSVTNCKNDNNSVESNQQNNPYTDCIGGVIGCVNVADGATVQINNLSNNAAVLGNENIGGVIGFVTATNSSTSLTINNLTMELMVITGERSVGGIIGGCTQPLTLTNAVNRSAIDAQGSDRRDFGGIIGAISTEGSVVLDNCQSGKNKMGAQPDPSQKYIDAGAHTGGLIGYVHAGEGVTLKNSSLTSNTYGTDQVGGLIGLSVSATTIENCRNDGGNIQASGMQAGGLVGQATGSISFNSSCVNQGNVEVTGDYAGGFVGQANKVRLSGGRSQANVTAGGKYSGGYVGYAGDLTAEGIDLPTITGTVIGNESIGGLAGSAGKASVSNVKLGYIVGQAASTTKYTGGLIGLLDKGTFNQCTFTGSVQGGEKTGGIVGYQQGGEIKTCVTRSENRILCNATGEVGGIAGAIAKTAISGCENHSTVVNVESEHLTGGIVGYIDEQPDNLQISGCKNYAQIRGGDQTGGIIGGHRSNKNSNIQVPNCHNTGDITGKDEVGGITGSLIQGQLYRCSNKGTIIGTRSAGGISGCIYGTESYYPNGLVNECFNTGRIDAPDKVGGIVGRFFGWSHATVKNSYNKGEIGHNGATSCAGIVGCIDNNAYSRIEYCYSGGTQRTGWGIAGRYYTTVGSEVTFVKCHYSKESAPNDKLDNPDCTKNSNGGLSSQSNFKGWDFSDTWVMKSMPELQGNRETNQ